MTFTDKHCAFWILQEAFDYLARATSVAVNWQALRLIVEAQKQVFAS